MITNMKFLKDHRCFKKGDTFTFRPGINLLVGEQGTGKSTILDILKKGDTKKTAHASFTVSKPIQTMSFDFEKDLPRGKSHFKEDASMMAQVAMLFHSHGEVVNALLKELETQKERLFLMDEPDMALSMRSAQKLAMRLIKASTNGCQIIAAVHNLIVIASVPEVLSLEHRKWMPSEEFISDHLGDSKLMKTL